MRTHRLLLLLGTAIVGSGCNCTGREFTISRTFHVTATDGLCQDYTDTINVGADANFSAVSSFVTRVELRKLSVTVTNPKTDPSSVAALASGTVRVADANNSSPLDLGTYGQVPITLNSTKEITFDAAAATNLANLVLHPPNTFTVRAHGCNDATPAFYDFRVDMTVYAGIL
jgi:hypothetical protein